MRSKNYFLISIMFFMSSLAWANQGEITTVVGYGYGDLGPSLSAKLKQPDGLAIDSAGNIYIVDRLNRRVRKIDSTGLITSIVTTGLNYPEGVAADSEGNVFISDENDCVFKVPLTGGMISIAGSDYSCKNKVTGEATKTELADPEGLAVDTSGNVYIADAGNNLLRKVTPAGDISIIAGTGINGFSGDGDPAIYAEISKPQDIIVDEQGVIYFTDSGNERIRKIGLDGVINTIAGTGVAGFSGDGDSATLAELNYPNNLVLDSVGNLIFSDALNNRIRKIDTEGVITTIAGSGEKGFAEEDSIAIEAKLDNPCGLVYDKKGNLYFSDWRNNRVRKIDPLGRISTFAGNGDNNLDGDGGLAVDASIWRPTHLAFDSKKNLYLSDNYNDVIRKVSTDGVIQSLTTSRELIFSTGMAIDLNDDLVYVEGARNRIVKVDSTGTVTTIVGTGVRGFSGDSAMAISAQLNSPRGIAYDSKGNLFIADKSNHRIRKVDTAGIITTVAGTGTEGFSGDSALAIDAFLSYPNAVSVDLSGNLFISEFGTSRIRKVDPNGIITTYAGIAGAQGFSGDGGLATEAKIRPPTDINLDSFGNLYIADSHNNRIRKIDTAGVITTVAGNGEAVYNGDNILATSAGLVNPEEIAIDAYGDLYISDLKNNRVRKVTFSNSGAEQTISFTLSSNLAYGTNLTMQATGGLSGNFVIFQTHSPSCAVEGDLLKSHSVGECVVIANQLGAVGYKPAIAVSQTIQVTPASIEVTAESQTKIFGEPDPQLSYLVNGLISGDTLIGALTRMSGEEVGAYEIQSNLLNSNYTINYKADSLVITQATQSIQVDSIVEQLMSTEKVPLNMTVSSGLEASIESQTPNVCIVENSEVSLKGIGLCKITLQQVGSHNFKATEVVVLQFEIKEDKNTNRLDILPSLLNGKTKVKVISANGEVKYEGHFHGVEELKKHGVSSGVYLLHWNKKTLQLRVP